MILVDSSVWMDHLRVTEDQLLRLLEREQVLSHPFVIGEILLGGLRGRDQILMQLQRLPSCIPAQHNEVLSLIQQRKLYSSGLGYIDVHLLAATQLTPFAKLWTRDKALKLQAEKLGFAFHEARVN